MNWRSLSFHYQISWTKSCSLILLYFLTTHPLLDCLLYCLAPTTRLLSETATNSSYSPNSASLFSFRIYCNNKILVCSFISDTSSLSDFLDTPRYSFHFFFRSFFVCSCSVNVGAPYRSVLSLLFLGLPHLIINSKASIIFFRWMVSPLKISLMSSNVEHPASTFNLTWPQ